MTRTRGSAVLGVTPTEPQRSTARSVRALRLPGFRGGGRSSDPQGRRRARRDGGAPRHRAEFSLRRARRAQGPRRRRRTPGPQGTTSLDELNAVVDLTAHGLSAGGPCPPSSLQGHTPGKAWWAGGGVKPVRSRARLAAGARSRARRALQHALRLIAAASHGAGPDNFAFTRALASAGCRSWRG